MFNQLMSTIIEGGVVDNKQTGNGIPGNTNTFEITLNGGWLILLLALLCIAVIILIIFIYKYHTLKNRPPENCEPKNPKTPDEHKLLNEYQKLNDRNKQTIHKTILTLIDKEIKELFDEQNNNK